MSVDLPTLNKYKYNTIQYNTCISDVRTNFTAPGYKIYYLFLCSSVLRSISRATLASVAS